ncbi:MAG: C-GCAxxG-C-C family (seleno)protein [Promethearchaeota archaeon]
MENDINNKFDEKIENLKKTLPEMRKGVNCCELTLTNILDVLGVDSYMFHNLAMPLAGGFGGYKAKNGWQGACGAVAGACAAIGVIMGGEKKMDDGQMAIAYLKASKYCTDFENEFGSVVCSKLCGYDFSTPEGFTEYSKSGTWESKCNKFVIWAVDHVRKLTKRDLRNKW